MPLTNKEKQRLYYNKHKCEPTFKEKLKLKNERKRQTIKRDNIKLCIVKKQNKLRSKRYRDKIKQLKISAVSPTSSYKSRGALSKAVNRVKAVLPASPSKMHSVIANLVKICDQPISPATSKPHFMLPADVTNCVKSFYERDEFTWASPNRKDVMPDGRNKLFLIVTIAELYCSFKLEYPSVKVGKSSFAKLRPQNVMLKNEIPHDQCLCKYCENMELLLKPLWSLSIEFPKSASLFIKDLVCNISSVDCMYNGSCKVCGNLKLSDYISNRLQMDFTTINVVWDQWTTNLKTTNSIQHTALTFLWRCASNQNWIFVIKDIMFGLFLSIYSSAEAIVLCY